MSYHILDSLGTGNGYVSSQELAVMAGATKTQILYWGRAGYLVRREGSYYMYPVSVLPKAKAMAVLVNGIGLEPEKASRLAERLVARFEDVPDTARAVIGFLKGLAERFDEVIDLMQTLHIDEAVADWAEKKGLLPAVTHGGGRSVGEAADAPADEMAGMVLGEGDPP